MELKTNSPHSISILIVEDDEVSLKLQSSIITLKFPDVMIYTATNGRQGMELFKAHTTDIVLTDINMSEMCGVQMAENIRANKSETKIIAITGNTSGISVSQSIVCNSDGKMVEFDHVIIKPVDISKLCGVIEQCIGEIQRSS